ncbi:helix-turn-helix transcriptional regulator [Acidovorax sp.]|uniref:helix-turn-helix transcriptional regulator n=1 Tax=Acidovorax sp. TaxID=1872122 RepID=UPI002ACD9B72|nr:helix-turn-helix transcriptional regulator [Acidovorax sp.]MDZ7862653.1 helix-turn-helix transcriptional regulator [Acidovorax sp.]
MQRIWSIFMIFSERLKQERERLGLTQPRLAEMLGVGKTTVINWEKGSSSPTAQQLALLVPAGMDVWFVMTGQIGPGSLSPEEQTLLGYFRAATSEVRRAALGALIGVAPSAQATNHVRDLTMHNTTPGGVQVGIQSGGSVTTVRKRK